MRSILLGLSVLLISIPTFAQQEYMKIKKPDGIRTMKVRLKSDIEVTELKIMNDSKETYIFTNGILKKISKDSITIKTSHYHTRKYYKDNSYVGVYSDYPWKADKMMKVAKEDIDYMHFWNSGKYTLHNVSISAMVMTLFTGLVVAPLVSYDFKNKSMNTNRYTGIVIGSSICLAVIIPIIPLTKSKTVSFTDKGRFKYKRWELVE